MPEFGQAAAGNRLLYNTLVGQVSADASYLFTGMHIDGCGFLYGVQSGVYRSDTQVDTPSAATPILPADGETGVDPAGAFAWTHPCTGNSFHLQLASDFEILAHP